MADSEFPCLDTQGLYAQTIAGDGNCLFSALSDQLYGYVNHSAEIRANVIDHIKTHKNFYVNFIDVHPGGGTRRQPKRRAATAYSASDFGRGGPSARDIDKAFDNYVREMAKGGTYGGNMEIVAFANCYRVHVRIWQAHSSYLIDAPMSVSQTAHIAYHDSYLHYSSVRNVGGPHSGPPEVKLPQSLERSYGHDVPSCPSWAINLVMASCHYPIDESTAIQALALFNNDPDSAVNYLYEQDAGMSTPDVNSIQSSSIERELGSDEEGRDGPHKRQDRRLSRARKERQRKVWLDKMGSLPADSLESLIHSEASSVRDGKGGSPDGASSPSPLADGSTSPDSNYSPSPEEVAVPPAAKGITLSLKPNKQTKPASKMVLKTGSPTKKTSARDAKALKKQAQKQARKARGQKQAPRVLEVLQPGLLDDSQSSFDSQASVMDEFRVIQI